MKMKAAVLYEHNAPLVVEEIDIDEPKANEVLVKIKAVGLCHTDLHYINGDMPARLPMVLGHEGSGIVEAVGESVTKVAPGDHVLMGVNTTCGECEKCVNGENYLCPNVVDPMLMCTLHDFTTRLHKGEDEIWNCFFQSSFAEYVVIRDTGVAKIDPNAPFDKICALGCGLGTGLGAVLRHPRFKMELGSTVAVFGCGAVGMSVIMGAKLANAKEIVAVDIVDSKLELAKEIGATYTVNASKEDAAGRIVMDLGPMDYAFDCLGSAMLTEQCIGVTKGSGVVVVVGAAPMGVTVPVELFNFTLGKTITGCTGGFMRPMIDLPNYVDLYMAGKLPLDKLVTDVYKLDDINQAIEDLKNGKALKAVIVP